MMRQTIRRPPSSGSKPEDEGRPWRERLRDDFDTPGVYEAFRAAIASGLSASKGVSKKCRCGRSVNVTLPDSANITRAAKELLIELEGVQKQPAAKPRKGLDFTKMTDEELEALIAMPVGPLP